MPDSLYTMLNDGATAAVWAVIIWRTTRWAIRRGRAAARRALIGLLTDHQQ